MRSTILLLCTVSIALPACAPADRSAAPAANVTKAQFQQIAWIVGKWHGAEAGGTPFFESYLMVDDSTLASTTWADSTFSMASDSSIISLRNGNVTSSSDAVATQWEGVAVHFEPHGKASNSYTWQKESPDRWTAHLFWTDKSGAPQERTYVMTRVAQ